MSFRVNNADPILDQIDDLRAGVETGRLNNIFIVALGPRGNCVELSATEDNADRHVLFARVQEVLALSKDNALGNVQ
jgi:hypothetical protein